MFIGHYAAAFALKGAQPKASLGMLFIATQFVDILFFPFVVMGIERLNIVPNFTASTHFELVYYPYTHGLLSSMLWAALFYLLYRYFFAKKSHASKEIAIVMALAIMSHWVCDLIVHTPDLPILGDNSTKVGFGLWNNKAVTFATEVGLLLLGLFYYLKNTQASGFWAKYGPYFFISFLIVIGYANLYVLPAAEDKVSLMISALLSYGIFAGLAFWVDRVRSRNVARV